MKAFGKDRSRRYETANGFARDVGGTADEGAACPPTSAYRFANSPGAPGTLATGQSCGLCAGTVVSTAGGRHAQKA